MRIVNKKAIEETRKPYCEVCGKHDGLQVHHIKTRGSGGDDVPENLICLCWVCHAKAHSGQLSKSFLRLKVRRRIELYGK